MTQKGAAPAAKPVISKPVVVIRHGKCGKVKLTKVGSEEVAVTAEWLKKLFGDDQILIIHSPVARAEETAKIIAGKTNGTLVPRTILNNGETGKWDEFVACMDRLQQRKDVRAILLVTHLELTATLCDKFGLHCKLPFDMAPALKNGEALVLNVNGTVEQYAPVLTSDN